MIQQNPDAVMQWLWDVVNVGDNFYGTKKDDYKQTQATTRASNNTTTQR